LPLYRHALPVENAPHYAAIDKNLAMSLTDLNSAKFLFFSLGSTDDPPNFLGDGCCSGAVT
jgi:hypothetical protein